jgi:hypothetical protein
MGKLARTLAGQKTGLKVKGPTKGTLPKKGSKK